MGKLYLIPTPVGNMEDITLRALRLLKEVDLVLAEDTRTSAKLLKHYEITTPLLSHHKFNEHQQVDRKAETLEIGDKIALISHAGTPGISDPGFLLTRTCVERGIATECLPGATAFVPALVNSGFPCDRFCFEGFLPRERKDRKVILEDLQRETRTIILYEAPHHLYKTLLELRDALGDRKIVLCKELTKKFESVTEGRLFEITHYYETHDPRGEHVLVLEGIDRKKLLHEEQKTWEEMSLQEHMAFYEDQGYENKDAMKMVAKDRGVTKREIYQRLLQTK